MKTTAGWMLIAVSIAVLANDHIKAQTASEPALYSLDKGSSFEQGCFPPCLCPIMIGEPVKGTFVLTPTGFDGLFNTYAVTEVNWVTSINGTNRIVTGSGQYKIGGEFALQQELSLDLQVGSSPVEHFDSGLVGVAVPFPDIQVRVSLHGEVCFDMVFSVSAAPAPVRPPKARSSALSASE